MKIFFRIVSVVLGLMTANAARAQSLWPETRAGMSVADVQRLYPEAHAPETPGELSASSAVELLEIDQTTLADHVFHVRFFFLEGRLVHVDLFETSEIAMKEFERFRDLLRGRYGLEYSTTSSETIRLEWHVIKTVIRLQWTPVSHGVATLSISYDAPIPKETDRL